MPEDRPDLKEPLGSPVGQLASATFTTSGVFTPPSGARLLAFRGCAGGGGGGGGGFGVGGEAGSRGEDSAEQHGAADELVPARKYVVLIGAGGLGGTGAESLEDHGAGGVAGGYTALTDGEGFVRVVEGGSASSGGDSELPQPPAVRESESETVNPAVHQRFAIVDRDSNVVDNVVVAPDGFFDDPFVIDAVLVHRIVRHGAGHALERRTTSGTAVRLGPDERVGPGWRVVSEQGNQRFARGSSMSAVSGGRGGKAGTSRGNLVDLQRPSLRILAMGSEWRSRNGGLSTFARELSTALAAEGHKIVCAVPSEVEPGEEEDAKAANVMLVRAPPTIGKRDALDSGLHRRIVLPPDFAPDVIIGHAHVSGPAAKSQVDDSFPYTHRVHFLHTQPGEGEWYKAGDASPTARVQAGEASERELATTADLAVGVGPRIHRELQRLLHPATTSSIIELIPGLTGDDLSRALPPTVEALLVGRMEDTELKGLDIAVESVKRVRASSVNVSLVVRGEKATRAAAVQKELSERLGVLNAVRVLEFDARRDVVRRDMLHASVVLMPSRTEGFGLVAWEAIGLGIPVLITDQSGVAELLQREAAGFAKEMIVPMSADIEVTFRSWAERLALTLVDRQAAFERAGQLRALLRPRFTWAASARKLVAAIRSLSPRSPYR